MASGSFGDQIAANRLRCLIFQGFRDPAVRATLQDLALFETSRGAENARMASDSKSLAAPGKFDARIRIGD